MTERLYYTDAYQQELTAVVQSKSLYRGKTAIELDQTCFYPTSGGQPNDLGVLNGLSVIDVVEDEDKILHVLETEALEVGMTVGGHIEWPRRFDHMQQHTGQHILSQAFLQILEAQTTSFHLGSDVSSIDIAREELTPEEIYRVEDLCNQVIFENRPINIHFVESQEQGFLLLRKPSTRSGVLRVIEITGFDHSPCGGTHCRSTAEVGLIKIRKWERMRKQARVEFYCGWRALRDYRWKNRVLYQLSRLYRAADTEIITAAEQHLNNEEAQRKIIAQLQDTLLTAEATQLLQESQEREGIQVICKMLGERDLSMVKELAKKIVHGGPKRLVFFGVQDKQASLLFTRSPDLPHDMREFIQVAVPFIEGRGGGNPQQAQAGGKKAEGLEEALNRVLEIL
jgi:alanyl-tRNA synthetase